MFVLLAEMAEAKADILADGNLLVAVNPMGFEAMRIWLV